MRRLLLSGLLLALLLTTAGVVYAGVSWDDDPSFKIKEVEGNLWGHVIAGWDGAKAPHADYKWTVRVHGDKVELKGCARKKGAHEEELSVQVWFSEGRHGDKIGLKEKQGRADRWTCVQTKIEWESGDDHHH